MKLHKWKDIKRRKRQMNKKAARKKKQVIHYWHEQHMEDGFAIMFCGVKTGYGMYSKGISDIEKVTCKRCITRFFGKKKKLKVKGTKTEKFIKDHKDLYEDIQEIIDGLVVVKGYQPPRSSPPLNKNSIKMAAKFIISAMLRRLSVD